LKSSSLSRVMLASSAPRAGKGTHGAGRRNVYDRMSKK